MIEQWEKSCDIDDLIGKATADRIQTEVHYRFSRTIDTGLPEVGAEALFYEFHRVGRLCIPFFLCSAFFGYKGIAYFLDVGHGGPHWFWHLLGGSLFLGIAVSWAKRTHRRLVHDLVLFDQPISSITRCKLRELVNKNPDATNQQEADQVQTYRDLCQFVLSLRECLAQLEKKRQL